MPHQDNEFTLTPDILQALGPPGGEAAEQNSSVSTSQLGTENHINRMKLIKDLTPRVREQKLQEHGVELLWVKTKDLLETSDIEQRNDMLSFFECIVRGQVCRQIGIQMITRNKGDIRFSESYLSFTSVNYSKIICFSTNN